MRKATVYLLIALLCSLVWSCGNQHRKVYVPAYSDRLEGSGFRVLTKRTVVDHESGSLVELDDDYRHIRIEHAGEIVSDILQDSDDYFKEFWSADRYLYAVKSTDISENDAVAIRKYKIVRFDRQGKMVICRDITEYQDSERFLRFAEVVDPSSFAFWTSVQGEVKQVVIEHQCQSVP